MNIKILSDSTCDLPKEILNQYNITLVPLTVVMDDRELKDGIDVTPADIFAHAEKGGALCSTSAVSVGEYEEYFERYASDYDGVVLINIGSTFSSSHQNALVATEDYPNVRCIDSECLSVAQGLIVLKACELAKSCDDLDTLCDAVKRYIPKVDGSFVLEQLTFLVKGGRCSAVAALGANLLNLKPCIELKDGKLTVSKKYRGSYLKCLTSYVKDRLAECPNPDEDVLMLVGSADQPEEYLAAVREVIAENSNFRQIVTATAGCTISCHCGPGTLGVMFLRK